jgi:hypothetical protein
MLTPGAPARNVGTRQMLQCELNRSQHGSFLN